MFVGFVQEPYRAPRIGKPDTPSLSLHSSPSSVLGSLGSHSPSNISFPRNHAKPTDQADTVDNEEKKVREGASNGEKSHSGCTEGGNQYEVPPVASPLLEGCVEQSEELTEEESPYHDNNEDRRNNKDSGTKKKSGYLQQRGDGE